jgi:2'-5' RNA ligase
LFVAADLPEDLRGSLVGLQGQLRGVALPIRWVRPEGIHLTFKFLGEIQESRLGDIIRALDQAGGRHIAPFLLRAAGVGTFPERGQPRILWVGVSGDVDAACRLKGTIDEALEGVGFAKEMRDFRPHLTLGRINGPGRGDWRSFLAGFSDVPVGAFEVRRCLLFQSLLGPAGATYRPLSELSLAHPG